MLPLLYCEDLLLDERRLVPSLTATFAPPGAAAEAVGSAPCFVGPAIGDADADLSATESDLKSASFE